MSDEPVATIVHTDAGSLPFQHYFVRHRSMPVVNSVEYAGAQEASPGPAFREALDDGGLGAIVVAPSNPFLSIGPILALAGVRDAIARAPVPVVAVSPIIGSEAVRGPAAKIMRELGHAPSAATVGKLYAGLVDGLVIDERDRGLCGEIEATGLRVCVTNTLMRDPDDQARLAQATLDFAADIARPGESRASR